MKDAFDIAEDIRNLINVPEIKALIGGGKVWTLERPASSPNIDIVVRANSGTNEADQVCYAFVNFYAPSITSTHNGKPQQLADQPTLREVSKAITPLIDGIYKPDFRCWVEEIPQPIKQPDGTWYMSTTVRYQSIQTNYKNI